MLWEAGVGPIYKAVKIQTALTTTAAHGYMECVMQLLELTVWLERERWQLENRLLVRCYHDIVKHLLGWGGCKANNADNSGGLPLIWAVGAILYTHRVNAGEAPGCWHQPVWHNRPHSSVLGCRWWHERRLEVPTKPARHRRQLARLKREDTPFLGRWQRLCRHGQGSRPKQTGWKG